MIPLLHQIMFTFAQIRVEATKQTLKYFSSADDSDCCILIELKCHLQYGWTVKNEKLISDKEDWKGKIDKQNMSI